MSSFIINLNCPCYFFQGAFWAAERTSRVAKTRAACASSMKDLDDIWARHAVLTQKLQNFADRAAVEKVFMEAESKGLRERAELADQKAQRAEMTEQEKTSLFSRI